MFHICVLSYNRKNLLQCTLESLHNTKQQFNLSIIDASTDFETLNYLKSQSNVYYLPKSNVGQAMNYAATLIKNSGCEYGLITADDYNYLPYWLDTLTHFWWNASAEIKIACANIEPHYAWNITTEVYEYGNHQYAFIRNSIPGSNWSFRTADIDLIFPVPEKTGGEDLETCNKLRGQGFKLASLDLTDHLGEKQSAWGNHSYKLAQKLTRLELLQKYNFIP